MMKHRHRLRVFVRIVGDATHGASCSRELEIHHVRYLNSLATFAQVHGETIKCNSCHMDDSLQ